MARSFARGRIRFKAPPEITPEMRVSVRASARAYIRVPQRWRRVPATWALEVATACGLPLEAVRWVNGNKHKPKFFYEHKVRRHTLWPPNLWNRFRLSTHRVPASVYETADVEDLKAFAARFKDVKTKHDTVRRFGKWWLAEPNDYDMNREIVPPKTNPTYLDGAVGLRFDDFFWTFAVIPYRFRDIPIEVLVATLYPDIPLEEVTYLPDAGTPEQRAYFEERTLRRDAWRVLEQRAPEGWGDLKLVPDGDGGYEATFLTEEGERLFTDHISMAEIIAGNAKFGITI